MADDGWHVGKEGPANDNRAPHGQDVKGDSCERLNAAVLSIARLIGRRMAREDYEKTMRAANDNDPGGVAHTRQDDRCADDD